MPRIMMFWQKVKIINVGTAAIIREDKMMPVQLVF